MALHSKMSYRSKCRMQTPVCLSRQKAHFNPIKFLNTRMKPWTHQSTLFRMHVFEQFVKCNFFFSRGHTAVITAIALLNFFMYFSKNSNWIKDDQRETEIKPDTSDTYCLILRTMGRKKGFLTCKNICIFSTDCFSFLQTMPCMNFSQHFKSFKRQAHSKATWAR